MYYNHIWATSVHTSSFQTHKHQSPPWIYIKPEPQDDISMGSIQVLQNDDGQLFVLDKEVISNRDEIGGEEHEDAVQSPQRPQAFNLGVM